MIYDFCNTYTIQKYCAIESKFLSDALKRIKLTGNKFEHRYNKETLIETKYGFINDWKNLNCVLHD